MDTALTPAQHARLERLPVSDLRAAQADVDAGAITAAEALVRLGFRGPDGSELASEHIAEPEPEVTLASETAGLRVWFGSWNTVRALPLSALSVFCSK